MNIDSQHVYLLALIPFVIIWTFLFRKREDVRKEMLVMSLVMGVLSVITSYYWWTVDWWLPPNLTYTRVGFEDFIMGFTSGGIMAVVYEVVFKRSLYKRKLHHHITGGLTLLFLLAQTTMWLFWGIGFTSFWSTTISMTFVALIMFYLRKDLIVNALISGTLMALVSLAFYIPIVIFNPDWIHQTYLSGLSGIRFIQIPIEEYIFWFMSGLVFGPFYEYWQGERLKRFVRKQ
jgi:hypothetical protein